MTENEAINELQANIDLPFGFTVSDEVSEIAIQALEEIQQYRAIGTVEELKTMKENGAFTGVELAQLAAMQMRLKEYSAIGTIEELVKTQIREKVLNVELESYKEIGTIEEFKGLKEKNTPYKPQEYEDKYYGCKCGEVLLEKWEVYPTKMMHKSWGLPYCLGCGQKLDWQ